MELLEAVKTATRGFNLCPNRIWEVGSRLDEWNTCLPDILRRFLDTYGDELDDKSHSACTFDFCEYSSQNFTSIKQRHEPRNCRNPCYRLRGLFNEPTLAREVMSANGRPTAWALDGLSILESSRPFMAISHVWSDGTGTGVWPAGEVNACLFQFFKDMATGFNCEGIWWDAISVPRDSRARAKALDAMEANYERAEVTLVHDCFLRNLSWTDDAETICFAIIMSPWFSRGWTALELAKSSVVKIVFANMYIADLDEDILGRVSKDCPAARAISKLRSEIRDVDDLLDTLGPRHTSWPKDLAIISGLLANVSVSSVAQLDSSSPVITSTERAQQQVIYQNVLRKLQRISHGHLFHGSATMSGGFSWCATSLFQLPQSRGRSPRDYLGINEHGEVTGKWKAIRIDAVPAECYTWGHTHPFTERAIELALLEERKHIILLEPGESMVNQGLLVKLWKSAAEQGGPAVKAQFIGAVHFHPRIDAGMTKIITIVIGDVEGWQELECDEAIWGTLEQATEVSIAVSSTNDVGGRDENQCPVQDRTSTDNGSSGQRAPSLSQAPESSVDRAERTVPQGPGPGPGQSIVQRATAAPGTRGGIPTLRKDQHGRSALSYEAERGNEPKVRTLLEYCQLHNIFFTERDGLARTVLHWAARGGSMDVFQQLLHCFEDHPASVYPPDKSGRTILHLAVAQGHQSLTRVLLNLNPDLDVIRAQDILGQTALHLAVAKRNTAVVGWLTEQMDRRSMALVDRFGCTALSCAAKLQIEELIPVLAEKLASEDVASQDQYGMTALHWCAEGNLEKGVETLLGKHSQAQIELRDKAGRTALHLAAMNGNPTAIEALVKRMSRGMVAAADAQSNMVLHLAIKSRNDKAVRVLLANLSNEDVEARDASGCTSLHIAAETGHEMVLHALLEREPPLNLTAKNDYDSTPLHLGAENGHAAVVHILASRMAPEDIVSRDKQDRTALHLAASSGSKSAVQALMARFPSNWITAEATGGRTALELAVADDNLEVASILADRLSPSELAANNGKDHTLLRPATRSGNETLFLMLLEKLPPKAYMVKDSENEGTTPLHMAAENGFIASVQLLVKNLPSKYVTMKDTWGQTALHLAAKNGHRAVVEALIDKFPAKQLTVENALGSSVLIEAMSCGDDEIVRMVLERAPKKHVEAGDWEYTAPLRMAAKHGDVALVQSLISKLPLQYLVANTRSKGTALHYAVEGGDERVVLMLTDRFPPAELAATDRHECTALHQAVKSGNMAVFQAILGRYPPNRLSDVDADGKSALYLAVRCGNIAMVRALLDKLPRDGTVTQPDQDHVTPLQLAAGRGDAAMTRLLLDRTSPEELTAKDAGNLQPGLLIQAIEGGNLEVFQMLLVRMSSSAMNAADNIVHFDSPNMKYINTPLANAARKGMTEMIKSMMRRFPLLDPGHIQRVITGLFPSKLTPVTRGEVEAVLRLLVMGG